MRSVPATKELKSVCKDLFRQSALYFSFFTLLNTSLAGLLSPTQNLYRAIREFWAQKAGRMGGYGTPTLTLPCLPASNCWTPMPTPVPLAHCRLAVCDTVWSNLPSVASIGPISELCKIVTFLTTAFGCNQCLNIQTRTYRINAKSIMI